MRKIRLGKTELMVTKASFGALPLQRRSMEDAAVILQRAYEAGINFYDTARGYTDSESKIGNALCDVRENIIIATKTHAKSAQEMEEHIQLSLFNLKTDYIDIYQFHNPSQVPMADSEMYQKMLEFKQKGWIRHISITAHNADNAIVAAKSGLYDTIQYPMSCLSVERDLEVVKACAQADIAVIGMKGMSGGLLSNADLSFSFLDQFDNVVPIWGIQHLHELEEFIQLDNNPPVLNEQMRARIQQERESLGGDFCRACGYCLSSCPQEIKINMCARISQLLSRGVWQNYVTPQWQEEMKRAETCLECGNCLSACPYELSIIEMLKKNVTFYKEFMAEKGL